MAQNDPNKRYYVTTPIYYVNDRPHIGHVYTTTVADVVARYHRLRGEDTFFLTGTDEHAAKVVDAAAERGMTAQQWADRNAEEFESTFRRLGLTHDDFIRTSQPRHTTRVQQYVKQLLDSGDVYLGDYEGWYDAGQEEYVPENKAKEYDFKSPINGKPLVKKKEQNYFFRLSAYADDLLTLLDGGEVAGQTFDVQPAARKNEIAARIREGLNDVPISRHAVGDESARWGISVPGDEKHTIYVWIDALFNYLSTVDTDDPGGRRKYWQSRATHLIAKDILWFHAAIWPALLLALRRQSGNEWINLPRLVYAHSFWIAEGQKMSKSLGNFIDLEKIDSYVETFGLDALRYFLASNGPMGTTDADFAEAKFIDVYNSDLANTFGNC
ncbi:MAG: methionine--tRNA ligase, partial [Phycisphaeraceae bacterium]